MNRMRVCTVLAGAAAAAAAGCGEAGLTLQAQLTSQTGYPQVEWTGTGLGSVDAFVIFRSDGGGGWVSVGQVSARTRFFVDKFDPVDGVEYRYEVAALRGDAELGRSPDVPQTSTLSL